MVISSQNNVLKYHTKGHEQVLYHVHHILTTNSESTCSHEKQIPNSVFEITCGEHFCKILFILNHITIYTPFGPSMMYRQKRPHEKPPHDNSFFAK